MPRKTTKKRPIDQAVSKSMNWWGKSFVFIKDKEVRSWQAIFAVAFCSGVLATLIWSIPSGISPQASAQDVGIFWTPRTECRAMPSGGEITASTTVMIRCGDLVTKGYYKLSDGRTGTIANRKPTDKDQYTYNNFLYASNNNLTLTLYGKWHFWIFEIDFKAQTYNFNFTKPCVDTEDGIDYYKKGTITDDFNDQCTGRGNELMEFYCENAFKPAVVYYNCPNGCMDGACIATSTSGNLLIAISSSTPPVAQVQMGISNYVLARFTFTADAIEDINLKSLTISDAMNIPAEWSVRNLKLYANGIQISEVSQASSSASTTANITFNNISLTIPKLTAKTVSLVGDISDYPFGVVSGSTHTFSILPDLSPVPVSAIGSTTGEYILGDKLDIGGENDFNVMANPMTIYRTNIIASWSSDTPQGPSTGAEMQTIGKINVTNLVNVGGYNSIIKNLNFKIISDIGNYASSTRYLKIYRDSINPANLVGTYTYAPGVMFSNTNLTQITPAYISSGQTMKFIVTLDTQGARANNYLSIGMDQNDITWSDGETQNIDILYKIPEGLKTLNY